MPPPKESPSTAVERALAMLDAVARRPEGMTNSELSRRLHIPKSSASYILRALEHHGYLRRDRESGCYHLGLKILSLSHSVQIGRDIRAVALPHLRQLVHRIELTAHLAILDGGEAVYVEKAEAPGFIKMDTWVGRRMQVNTTSVGKALVAYLPQEEVDEVLREHGLHPRTPKSITNRARFLKELERVRAVGYSVDDEENSVGARCVAAPIFNEAGEVAGALGVSGATNQISKADLPKIGVLVKEAARRISQQLGATRSPAGPLRILESGGPGSPGPKTGPR